MNEHAEQDRTGPATQARIRDSFGHQGLMRHLGARITEVAPGRVRIVLPSRPEVTQQHGYVHAGATSAIADSAGGAGGYAALTLFAEDSEVLTVEYKTNLLAPPTGEHLEAVGTVLKSGRTLTVCRLEVLGVQEDGRRTLVANGQQTLIRVDAPESA